MFTPFKYFQPVLKLKPCKRYDNYVDDMYLLNAVYTDDLVVISVLLGRFGWVHGHTVFYQHTAVKIRDTIDSIGVEILAWQILSVQIVFLYWAARFTKQRIKGSICEHANSIVTTMTFKYSWNDRTHTVPILQYPSNQSPPSSIVLPFTIPHSFQWLLKGRWLCRPWQHREKSAM